MITGGSRWHKMVSFGRSLASFGATYWNKNTPKNRISNIENAKNKKFPRLIPSKT